MRILIAFLFCLALTTSCYAAGGSADAVLLDVWNETGNSLGVDLNPGSSIVHHQKVVGTAGTAVQLSADSTALISLTISCLPSNTQNIYVGISGVSSDNGFILSEDTVTAITLDTDNAQDVYLDSDINGEGVSWVGLVK